MDFFILMLVIPLVSSALLVDHVLALPEDTKLMILAPVVVNRKGEQLDLFAELRAQGFVRLRVDGAVHDIDALPKLASSGFFAPKQVALCAACTALVQAGVALFGAGIQSGAEPCARLNFQPGIRS